MPSQANIIMVNELGIRGLNTHKEDTNAYRPLSANLKEGPHLLELRVLQG
jgi:hypothetical protein